MQTRIFLIPLFRGLTLSTDGTVTAVPYDIKSDRFKTVLPFAVSLTLYSLTEGENATNDVEWNVVFRSGFDRDHELASANKLESAALQINTNGSKRHAAFTDTSKFLLESRLQATAQNRAAAAGAQLSIVASAVLAVETVGM